VDALKEQWSHREEILEPVKGPNILVDRTHGHNH